MTFPRSAFEWLSHTAISQDFNEADYLYFGFFMAAHLLGIALLVGPSLLIDLRALGIGIRAVSFKQVERTLKPWLLAGLVVAALSGSWLFVADPLKYYVNPAFRLKALFLLLALIAQFFVARKASKWAALLAALLWLATAIGGRVVGLL